MYTRNILKPLIGKKYVKRAIKVKKTIELCDQSIITLYTLRDFQGSVADTNVEALKSLDRKVNQIRKGLK